MKICIHIVQYTHNIIQKTEYNLHVYFMKYDIFPSPTPLKNVENRKKWKCAAQKKRDRIGKNDKHIWNQHPKISLKNMFSC